MLSSVSINPCSSWLYLSQLPVELTHVVPKKIEPQLRWVGYFCLLFVNLAFWAVGIPTPLSFVVLILILYNVIKNNYLLKTRYFERIMQEIATFILSYMYI